MKLGATDYIAKPVQPDVLLTKMSEALAKGATPVPAVHTESAPTAAGRTKQPATKVHAATKDAVKDASKDAAGRAPGIEGHSPAATELYRMASLVAPTPMSVLIIGASGTGKEYVAHRIHEQSSRADGPFVAIDCGALTKELAASELFGHVKGAFTGAGTDKTGAFEQASGGTLFLDEVGNLSYDVQVQLLRALQERRVRPVGSTDERPIDIRLVCATNENLPEAIAQGRYREDLYHRINEFTLHIPLLRERGADILEFATYFLQKANAELHREVEGFTAGAERAPMAYPLARQLARNAQCHCACHPLGRRPSLYFRNGTRPDHRLCSPLSPCSSGCRSASTLAHAGFGADGRHSLRSPAFQPKTHGRNRARTHIGRTAANERQQEQGRAVAGH